MSEHENEGVARTEMTLPPSSAMNPILSDAALAEALAKLAPNRMHESSWLKNLLCGVGLHRWYRPNLGIPVSLREVGVCRWCPKVKVRGVIYGD
jgi:hypothetical protein